MHTQEGLNKCDYCDGMEGYFDDASGNHVSCIEKERAYAKIAELRERVIQDELAFVQMIHANTRLTEDVKRLTAELAQCKHALDDKGEMCECGHPMSEHSHKHGAGCLVLMNDWVYCKCEATK